MLHRLQVPADAAGSRLDVWLESRLEGCSRSLVTRLIKEGLCAVASPQGQPMRAKQGLALRGGESVELEVPEVEPSDLVPEDLPLTILHEDEHLVVIDKPAGLVVHPAIGHPRGTLANGVLGRYGPGTGGEPWRPGIAHRLDEDTSGVIVVARTPAALVSLQDSFRERRAIKRYLALVHGSPRADVFEHAGWIGRHPKDFRKRAVLPDGTSDAREAFTSFIVRHRADGYVVVEGRPRTGRTHQIRVHLAALGHPVLADSTYGRSATWPIHATPNTIPAIRRQALHAWSLEVPHPAGGVLKVSAPIPADLAPWVPATLTPLG